MAVSYVPQKPNLFVPPASIFADEDLGTFTKYRLELTFLDRVMGGIPQKPELIEGWLRKKMIDDNDAEIRQMMLRTLDELGMDVNVEMTHDELYEVARHAAATQTGNTFYRDEQGLYLSGYQPKAALKECVNILFAGEKWGATRKGPKNFVTERVFVDELRIHLGRMEPDGTHLQIGQINGPRGPRSTLTYVHYVEHASISMTISSLKDCVTADQWRQVFLLMQKGGLGALRSMGNGQFAVTAFDRL